MNTMNPNENPGSPARPEVTRYLRTEAVKNDIRHRYNYHAPRHTQQERYETVRAEIANLAIFISERCPDSRELSTALTHLDAVMFYANAAIARNEGGHK